MNHEDAYKLIFVVSLPVIMRGHSIQLKLSHDLISIRVPNLYALRLGIPRTVDCQEVKSFFECKLRKLIIVLTVKQKEVSAPTISMDEDSAADMVEEEREVEDTVRKTHKVEIVDTYRLENDMLFDIV